jgi:hypothetical protein
MGSNASAGVAYYECLTTGILTPDVDVAIAANKIQTSARANVFGALTIVTRGHAGNGFHARHTLGASPWTDLFADEAISRLQVFYFDGFRVHVPGLYHVAR